MRTTKGFPKRLTAGLLSIVMLLSLLPALSTPAEAAQTSYANDPKWYSIDEGADADSRMETLSILLRYQKGKPEENLKNEIPENLESYFDQYYVGDTLYIRLNHDIDVKVNPRKYNYEKDMAYNTDDWHYNLPVYGNKVLDLNGHKIKVQQRNDWYQSPDPIFEIKNGATLTVVDSKGGGKMIANSWIKMYLDLFSVDGGGELILNAPGATFECGYSEKVWLVNAYTNGDPPKNNQTYNGYARNQASGNAVVVYSGGKLTVSGGTVKGRGHDSISVWGQESWTSREDYKPLRRCAAIDAKSGSTVHIIDGNFYGMGGADALQISDKASLTIESGVFDTYKIDKIVLPKADRDGKSIGEMFVTAMSGWLASAVSVAFEGDKVDNYMDGEYGYIGIPTNKLAQLSAKGSAVEVITGDHDVSGDELSDEKTTPSTDATTKRVTIRPKTGSATADSRVTIEPANGMYAWNPSAQKAGSFEVNVSFDERYFSEDARELAASYYRERKGQGYGFNDKDKEYYLNYRFTLYDKNGDKKAFLGEKRLPASSTSFPADLTKLPDLSSSGKETYAFDITKWKALEVGDYTVRCEVIEVWKGEHTYKSAWFADMPLTITDSGLVSQLVYMGNFKLDFDVYHTEDQYTEDGAQYMTVELSGADTALYKAYKDLKATGELPDNARLSDITVQYTARNYDPDGSEVNATSALLSIYDRAILASPGTGAKVITATINVPRYAADGTITGYDKLSASKNFLLLPKLDQWEGKVRHDAVYGYHEAVNLDEGQSASIFPPDCMSEELKDKGTFTWQWRYVDEHDMYVGESIDSDAYKDHNISNSDKHVELTADGTYRLKCTYQPSKDGSPKQEFVSVPIDVYSSDTQVRKAYLQYTGLQDVAYRESATIQPADLKNAHIDAYLDGGDWSEVKSVTLRMIDRPAGVERGGIINGSPYYANAYSKEIKCYNFYLADFLNFKDAINNGRLDEIAGEYTFRATIKCDSGEGYHPEYKIYTNEIRITIEKAATGYALSVGGQYLGKGQTTLSEAQNQAVPLFLNSISPYVRLSMPYYPENATQDLAFAGLESNKINYKWSIVGGSYDVITLTQSDLGAVHATIGKPGTTIIEVKKWYGDFAYESSSTKAKCTTYFKVCVPVTKVEFWQPDYQEKINQSYIDVLPSVTAYATCGVSRSDAFDFSIGSAEYKDTGYAPAFWNSSIHLGSDSFVKRVTANDKGEVIYPLRLKEGQSYLLKKENATDYVVDTSAVKLTIKSGDGEVTKTADKWGVSDKGGFSTKTMSAPNDAYFQLRRDVFVEDRNAQYIDLVVISTTEPRVGDPINEKVESYDRYGTVNGESWKTNGNACKKMDVFSLSSVKASNGTSIILPYYSYVSKATAETAGAPYTDASGAKKDGQKSWEYGSSFLNSGYENGTYIHELQLYTNSNATENGTKYYFSPNCKIIMNGNLLDFGDRTMYSGGYSYLTFKYFYDVGEVNRVDELTLTGIQPQQGNEPAEPADVTATGFEYPSGGGSKTANAAKIDVTKLIWFVDKDEDGQLDEGEEVKTEWKTTTNDKGETEITGYDAENSTLWWDGTFLGGVEYSALVEIAAGDSATRMSANVRLNCDGKLFSLPSGQSSFVVKFDADNTIRTIHLPIPTGAAAASPDRDPLGLFEASNQGYSAKVSSVYKHMPEKDGVSTLDRNVSNFYDVDTDLKEETLTEGKYWMILSAYQKNGCTIASDVKVLINGVDTGEFGYGKEQVKEMHVASRGNSASVWRTFEVPAGETPSSGLLGDVNGDGVVDILDHQGLFEHLQGISVITDAQTLKAADTTKNGVVDILDHQRLFEHLQGISLLS